MIVSILQMMGFPVAKPVNSRAGESPSDKPSRARGGVAASEDHGQASPARRQEVKAKAGKTPPAKSGKKSAPKAVVKTAVKVVSKATAKKPVPKAPAKPVAKPAGKALAKSAAKPTVKAAPSKPAPKPLAKGVKIKPSKPVVVAKAPLKSVAKPAAKAAVKPVAKAPVKPVAKVAAKPTAKVSVPSKANPVAKAVVKPAAPVAVKLKTPAPVMPAAKPAAKVAPKPVSMPSAVAPVTKSKPVVAPVAPVTVPPVPAKAGRPSSRLAQVTVPSMAQSVASTAAKSSYAQSAPEVLIVPMLPSSIKKDAKLANNWKTTPADKLTDAELIAMPDSEYMSEIQLAAFKVRLTKLKGEILASAGETTEHLREDSTVTPDPADRATIEEEHALELRTRDRERKLLKKIEQSIVRIDAGDYGYCDETGEAIGVGRLLARPTATLSLEAQQRRELKQKMFGD